MNSFANGRLSGLVWSGLARHVGTVSQRVSLTSYRAQISPIFCLPSVKPRANIALWLQFVAGRTEAQDPIRGHGALQHYGKISSSLCDGHLR